MRLCSVSASPTWKVGHQSGSFFGVGEGRGTKILYKLWILTGLYVWTLGLGIVTTLPGLDKGPRLKGHSYCFQLCTSSFLERELLRKCKNWNFLQYYMKDNLIFAHSVTCATLKAILNGVFIFRSYIVFCTSALFRTCSEAYCVLFLNIYFFNMLSTCQQKQSRQKRAVFEDC